MSCVVALVAGFTGLSLTRGLAKKPVAQKKVSIALASVALGGGIWAMHFVAMLGLQLPILFYYDAAITLVSALSAILIVGAALILLHFAPRTPGLILLAGGAGGQRGARHALHWHGRARAMQGGLFIFGRCTVVPCRHRALHPGLLDRLWAKDKSQHFVGYLVLCRGGLFGPFSGYGRNQICANPKRHGLRPIDEQRDVGPRRHLLQLRHLRRLPLGERDLS
jgi:hypothetical protein